MTTEEMKIVDGIVARYNCDKGNLIPIMQDVQSHFRYLPKEILLYVADKIDVSISKIFGVATFYENFSLEAKGKYVLRVCDGTACHVRKSTSILNAINEELGLDDKKHTTDDMLFTLETVSCLGACGLAPVMVINDDIHPAMTPDKVRALINEIKEREKHG